MTLRPDNHGSHGRQGQSRPDACSVIWDKAGTSALGTAPAARFWLALEQNGPWGARAATQSHLDPDLGTTLDRMCQDAGGRLILIRRPGAHPDPPESRKRDLPDVRPQRVYLAGGLAARPWLLEADLADPARLASLARLPLDTVLDTLGTGGIDQVRAALPEFAPSHAPVLMICSNSRRDVCCAVRGRPVALESAAERPGRVWECSHTGGHRFAPTGVLLPHGQTFGRLSGRSAVAAVDAATRGEVPTQLLGATYDRGRSHLTAAAQAAESMVRQQIQEPVLMALSTTAELRQDHGSPQRVGNPASTDSTENTESRWHCRVSHLDGRRWDVVAVRSPRGDDLRESCGKAPVPTWQWSVLLGFGR